MPPKKIKLSHLRPINNDNINRIYEVHTSSSSSTTTVSENRNNNNPPSSSTKGKKSNIKLSYK